MMLFVGIGELLWDIYTEDNSKCPGGAPFNCVHHAVQLGHTGSIISRIGKDPVGYELLACLKKRGISTEYVQFDGHYETGFVEITLDMEGEPRFQCSESAPYDFMEWNEDLESLAPEVDVVVFGTFSQRNEQSAQVTKRFLQHCTKAVRVFDVNFREWTESTKSAVINSMPDTDILKMNEPELARLKAIYPELNGDEPNCLIELVKQKNLQLACLTADKWGCLISDGESVVYCPGLNVRSIDKTGAGDAFISAFVLKFLECRSVSSAGTFANSVAALTLQYRGATPEYDLESLDEYMSDRYSHNIHEEWRNYTV